MFSGKTSALIAEIEKYIISGKKCLIVKYSGDTRYETENTSLIAHNGRTFTACPVLKLDDILTIDATHYDVIGISEGQFFKNTDQISQLAKTKIIIIEGLSGDFMQRPFSAISNLISLCNELIVLKSVCMKCGSFDGAYTIKTTENKELIDIGGSDKYKTVCRECL